MTDFDFSSVKDDEPDKEPDGEIESMMQHLDEARKRNHSDESGYECFRCGSTEVHEIDVKGQSTKWICKRCGYGNGNRVV